MARRGESGINCLLAINKPQGLSSHDVVNCVRRALGERRVGHAGTLDPLASGVLVVGVGQGTRLMGLLTMDNKAYRALIEFGTQTTTDDAEGEAMLERPVPASVRDAGFAAEAVRGLVGMHEQVPPAFSAISVDGRRAYDRARAGESVELASRRITIMDAALVAVMPDEPTSWVCDFTVSKGTYIRSIARDLGVQLGTAAHLSALERRSSGSIGLSSCVALDALQQEGPALAEAACLDPAAALGFERLELTDAQYQDVMCGKRLRVPSWLADGAALTLVHGGQVVGVWRRAGAALQCVANFPSGISGVRG